MIEYIKLEPQRDPEK